MMMIVASQALASRVGRLVMIIARGYLIMIGIIVVLNMSAIVMMIVHHKIAKNEMFVILWRSGDMLNAVYPSRRSREVKNNQKPDAKRRPYPLQ